MFDLNNLIRQWQKISSHLSGHRRIFRAMQVEVTTSCNFSCQMCPMGAEKARGRDMEWSTYLKLAEEFPMTEIVYLQGWGEPLLHPEIIPMVELAKSKGCQVGFTTNGSLLSEETIVRLVDQGIDFITVSIAGAIAATHEGIRKGSNFDGLMSNISQLVKIRNQRGLKRPKVTLSYLMLEANLRELTQGVELACRLGCDEMLAANLDFPACAEEEQNRVFDWGPAPPDRLAAVHAAVERAKALGLNLRVYPLELGEEVLVCEMDPVRQLFVNIDGDIAPCVYMNIAGQAKVERFFKGKKCSIPKTVYGNIKENRLKAIWETAAYINFREVFKRRQAIYPRIMGEMMGEAVSKRDLQQMVNPRDGLLACCPLPSGCNCCYKAYNA
jgi:MoaA/NifB/PqqE/SkfB family radical SAM enzyme